MVFFRILIGVIILWLVFWFGMMPMDQWAGSFILDLFHPSFHDKALIEVVVLENQDLWFGLVIIATLIYGGYQIAKA